MKYTAGFIGCGNMGATMARAAAKAVGGSRIAVCDHHPEKTEALRAETGAVPETLAGIAAGAGMIFLGVKPDGMEPLLRELCPMLAGREETVLISMASGLTVKQLADMSGGCFPVIRMMPNTPCASGKGMVVYTTSDRVSADAEAAFCSLMAPAGMVCPIEEKKIDAFSALAGCGPAFAYLFAEALADGGVECGLSRAQATEFAARMMLGSAQMILDFGHPSDLKDAVCSPGGTTIVGVHALARGGMHAAVMDAVVSAYRKTIGK